LILAAIFKVHRYEENAMKPSRCPANTRLSRLRWPMAVLAGFVLSGSLGLGAQSPPPVRGTIALEGTMKKFYKAANTVIVATKDGIEHVYHFTKDLLVHGGRGAGVDALSGLREGTTVVVHYVSTGADQSAVEIDRIGDEGLKVTEGIVHRIDRKRSQITIRFDNGTTETLRLTERAAAEASTEIARAPTETTKIIVYYSDEGGRKVAHYFKKAS
jgi:hypothetical protein